MNTYFLSFSISRNLCRMASMINSVLERYPRWGFSFIKRLISSITLSGMGILMYFMCHRCIISNLGFSNDVSHIHLNTFIGVMYL